NNLLRQYSKKRSARKEQFLKTGERIKLLFPVPLTTAYGLHCSPNGESVISFAALTTLPPFNPTAYCLLPTASLTIILFLITKTLKFLEISFPAPFK
ncbi:MAG: hypothetical protein IKS45_05955, partial [Thermoguttaceae bacterium]|nr:hypothetical protein [Thermoguttaceae bacterium]